MNTVTRFWGWALLVAGLSLAVLALAPQAQAHHFLSDHTPVQVECDEPDNFGHFTARQQALCGAGVTGGTGSAGSSISELVQRIIKILSWVAGVAAIIVVIVQGLRMILSGGDSNSNTIASARNGIIYALIGLAVAISAPHLVGYILTIIGN